jgi:hypothetical protein
VWLWRIFRRPAHSRILRSAGTGELEAWLQLASRDLGRSALASVVTSLCQVQLDRSEADSRSRMRGLSGVNRPADEEQLLPGTSGRGNETKRGADQNAGGESRSRVSSNVAVCNSGVVANLGDGGVAAFCEGGLRLRDRCLDSVT